MNFFIPTLFMPSIPSLVQLRLNNLAAYFELSQLFANFSFCVWYVKWNEGLFHAASLLIGTWPLNSCLYCSGYGVCIKTWHLKCAFKLPLSYCIINLYTICLTSGEMLLKNSCSNVLFLVHSFLFSDINFY